ncbi:SLC13 family permease [bacterium]|nr:SLC13 family permease [candidate division CSSED10-310 bacterium]
MSPPQLILIVVVAVPLVLVGLDRLRIDLAALLMASVLGILQYLGVGILGTAGSSGEAAKAIAGFGQPVVLTLISLFIITRVLDRSGITRWIARWLLKIGGHSERYLIALLAATTALLSLVINNLAAGALVLPSAMEIARRTGIKPSKLLIPVSFGSLFGGVATYFTTANIILSDLLAAANPPQPPLHIMAFTPTGGLVAMAGIAFLALFGKQLLPERDPAPEQMMARLTGSDLEEFYQLGERLWEIRVSPVSPLAGKRLSESGIGERFGLTVIGIVNAEQTVFAPSPDQVIQPDDVLLIVGREDRISGLAELDLTVCREGGNGYISRRGARFIEIMPSPHSQAFGRSLRDLEFRKQYQLTALALYRGERCYRTDVGGMPIQLGDALLMIGPRTDLPRLRNNPNFIVLEPGLGDQPVQRGPAALAIGVLAAAITLSVLGLPTYLTMTAGAVVLILAGVLDMEEVYRFIDWQVIVMIAGMYSVSLAMVNTDLAQTIGAGILHVVTPLGPLGLAGGAYLLAALFTQVIGGQVTALVIGPITISAALALHANPHAIAVATAIGCSAAFCTPFAHPVNVMMVAPANYRFRDFFRIGWRLTIVNFIMLMIGMLLFWKF